MRISVRFSVDIPDDLPGLHYEQIQDWLEFNLGATCSMLPSPISDRDLEAVERSVWFERES